jgi:predicted RNA methylase
VKSFRLRFAGLVRPCYVGVRRLSTLAWDRHLGIVTDDTNVGARLGRPVDRGSRPISYLTLARLQRRWRLRMNDTLLDVGSGSGRVICYFASRGVGRVIGVEIDEDLVEMARANSVSLALEGKVDVVRVDALDFDIPSDVTAVFLYNPFAAETLERVVDNLVAAHARHGRRLRLAYANPIHREVIARRFTPAGHFHSSWRPDAEWRRNLRVDLFELAGS